MQHRNKLAIALSFLAVIGTVEVAQARLVIFGGTRSQVVGACIGPSRQFSSGLDGYGVGWARCVDSVRNTSVICDELGSCVGSYNAANKPKPKPRRPPRVYEVPESLSEAGEPVVIDMPAPEPDIDIIN